MHGDAKEIGLLSRTTHGRGADPPLQRAGGGTAGRCVSVRRVSRLHAGCEHLAGHRAKVEAAAAELGYHVNHLARGLMAPADGIVCLVVADIQTPYLVATARKPVPIASGSRQGRVGAERRQASGNVEGALRQTLNYRADATVVLSAHPIARSRKAASTAPAPRASQSERSPARHRQPFGRQCPRCPKAATLFVRPATSALPLSPRGSELQASWPGESALSPTAAGPGPTSRCGKARDGVRERTSGRETALFSSDDPPDAVFAVTDLMACGVMDAVRHRFRRRVPTRSG